MSDLERAFYQVAEVSKWVDIALDGGAVSDFAASFGSVRKVLDLRAEKERLRDALIAQSHEIEQILGKALHYPWFKDDPENFPDATEADGVCIGEHVPASLADEAAQRIKTQEDMLSERTAELHRLRAANSQGEKGR